MLECYFKAFQKELMMIIKTKLISIDIKNGWEKKIRIKNFAEINI